MNTPINFARSLAALFIGFFVLAGVDTILTALTLKFFFATPATPTTGEQPLSLLGIKIFSGLIGGYVTASLAGTRRWQHALLLAGIILSLGMVGLAAMKDAPRSAYTIYALILSPLSVAVGGWLRSRQS